jgi:hypothetical protein
MYLDKTSLELLIQEQMVRNAKDVVARRERDFNYAGESLRYAKDTLHNEEVRLVRLRETILTETLK